MINLFSVLKKRETQQDLDLYQFPEQYKKFISKYSLQREQEFIIYYQHKESDNRDCLGTFILPLVAEGDFFELYHLFSIDETYQVFEKLYKNNEDYKDIEILPIGSGSMNTVILVGTGQDNSDEIYLEVISNSIPPIIKVADNIFEFISFFEFTLEEDLDMTQMYKNGDEEFWRLKNERKN